jgi:hypothetical protein
VGHRAAIDLRVLIAAVHPVDADAGLGLGVVVQRVGLGKRSDLARRVVVETVGQVVGGAGEVLGEGVQAQRVVRGVAGDGAVDGAARASDVRTAAFTRVVDDQEGIRADVFCGLAAPVFANGATSPRTATSLPCLVGQLMGLR